MGPRRRGWPGVRGGRGRCATHPRRAGPGGCQGAREGFRGGAIVGATDLQDAGGGQATWVDFRHRGRKA